MDFGCGGGSFLDSIKGIAKKTIAVEPFVGYHESLKLRGHEVYSDILDCSLIVGSAIFICRIALIFNDGTAVLVENKLIKFFVLSDIKLCKRNFDTIIFLSGEIFATFGPK